MQRIITIAALTWKAAFRFRLFIVVAVLLLLAVVGLPLVLKDDGTARGFTQILLTYTLSSVAVLLGLSTLWLSCGTLARDIEECQMQMVVTKPIARWQVWLGKWMGIMSLNAALLFISGTSVYVLMQVRAAKLSPEEQHVLKNEIFVARGSAKERSYDAEINQATEIALADRIKKNPDVKANLDEVTTAIREQVKAQIQVVPPGYIRTWDIELGPFAKILLRDQPIYIRAKFNAAQQSPSGTFYGEWQVGDVNDTKKPVWASGPMSLAPDTFHEFEIPANQFNDKGTLTISFRNDNPVTLLFPLDDGMEVLYRQGGFAMNFARGLGIIFCWMALLAAVGLASASLLSFPVATFVSLGLLMLVLSSGTIESVVASGRYFTYNAEKGPTAPSFLDHTIVEGFKGILVLVDMVKEFSPVDSLSRGRSIPWSELGRAFAQIVLLMGGIVSAIGIFIFSRRELAAAQGTQ